MPTARESYVSAAVRARGTRSFLLVPLLPSQTPLAEITARSQFCLRRPGIASRVGATAPYPSIPAPATEQSCHFLIPPDRPVKQSKRVQKGSDAKASAAQPAAMFSGAGASMVTPGMDHANGSGLPLPGQQAGDGQENGHRSPRAAPTATAVTNGGGEQRMVGPPDCVLSSCGAVAFVPSPRSAPV